jgi:hypothetical protein
MLEFFAREVEEHNTICKIFDVTSKCNVPKNNLFRYDMTALQWCFNDQSYLRQTTDDQTAENEWGRKMLAIAQNRPEEDIGQWSGPLGELLFKNLCDIQTVKVWRPEQKKRLKPDFETKLGIYEIKTGTWNTTGTAHAKIGNVPWNYAPVLRLYNKPPSIICIARAMEYALESQYILRQGEQRIPERQEQYDVWCRQGIRFIDFRDLLMSLISENPVIEL